MIKRNLTAFLGESLSSLRIFWRVRAIQPLRLASVLALSVCSLIFETFGVAMVLPLMDFLQTDGDLQKLSARSKFWPYIIWTFSQVGLTPSLESLSVVILALVILRQSVNYALTIATSEMKHDVGRKLSNKLFGLIMSSRAEHIQKIGSGAFVTSIDHKSQAVAFLLQSYISLFGLILTFLCYGSVVFTVAPLTSLLGAVIAFAVIGGMSRWVRIGKSLSYEIAKFREGFVGFLNERYRAWRLIKLADAAERETTLARSYSDRYFDLSVGLMRAGSMSQLFVTPIMMGLMLLSLNIAVLYLDLSASAVLLFVVVMVRLIPTAQSFAGMRQAISTYTPELDRFYEIFTEAKAARETNTGRRVFDAVRARIEFRNVSFRYEGGAQALSQVSLEIPAHKMTAIMGPSGAGKSTLIDLIPRLIEPESGEVLIDDVNLKEFTLSSLRRQVAYASQNPIIFNASALDNVRYVRPDASRAEVEAACRAANAHDFVSAMAGGYDTIISEGGADLSGGQRQRLVLARAFLAGASLVILDEPTSALDYESDEKIKIALRRLVEERGATLLVIAHRLSTVRHADHVIVLRDGGVVEAGDPRKLSRDDNWYASMLALDARERELSPAESAAPLQ